MSKVGWKAMERLGVRTFVCEYCKLTSSLYLPVSRVGIRERHWRVEKRWRRDSLLLMGHNTEWITCSQECAVALAERERRAYGQRWPKLTFAVHGPYTPNGAA